MTLNAADLQQLLHEQIPLTQAMALRVVRLEHSLVQLSASLAANHNHHGGAFGGSLASLMTLSGWALLLSRLRQARVCAELMIQQQQLSYTQPVHDDFYALCRLPDETAWDKFVTTLNRRGRARVSLTAQIFCDSIGAEKPNSGGNSAATMDARYVAIMRNTNA